VDAHLTRAQNQVDLGVNVNAEPLELLGVGSELQQGRDLRATCELAVLHAVSTFGRANEEVGEADEGDRQLARLAGVVSAVDERGLHDDRHTAPQGVEGLRGERLIGVEATAVGAIDLKHVIGVGGLRAVVGDDRGFVRVAHRGGALEHRIRLVGDHRDPPQLRIEVARNPELALGGARQIARRGHEQSLAALVGGQVHRGSPLARGLFRVGARGDIGSGTAHVRPHDAWFDDHRRVTFVLDD